ADASRSSSSPPLAFALAVGFAFASPSLWSSLLSFSAESSPSSSPASSAGAAAAPAPFDEALAGLDALGWVLWGFLLGHDFFLAAACAGAVAPARKKKNRQTIDETARTRWNKQRMSKYSPKFAGGVAAF